MHRIHSPSSSPCPLVHRPRSAPAIYQPRPFLPLLPSLSLSLARPLALSLVFDVLPPRALTRGLPAAVLQFQPHFCAHRYRPEQTAIMQLDLIRLRVRLIGERLFFQATPAFSQEPAARRCSLFSSLARTAPHRAAPRRTFVRSRAKMPRMHVS